MERRRTGGNCDWVQEDAFLEIPCLKCETWLAMQIHQNWNSLIKTDHDKTWWMEKQAATYSSSEKIFPNAAELTASLLCTGMSGKKWWHTHTRRHVAGVGGLWQHIVGECWGIYLTGKLQRVCVRVCLLETEGGVFLSRRCIPDKSSCPLFLLPLLRMYPSSV